MLILNIQFQISSGKTLFFLLITLQKNSTAKKKKTHGKIFTIGAHIARNGNFIVSFIGTRFRFDSNQRHHFFDAFFRGRQRWRLNYAKKKKVKFFKILMIGRLHTVAFFFLFVSNVILPERSNRMNEIPIE